MNGDGYRFSMLGGNRILVRLHAARDEPSVAILVSLVLGVRVKGLVGPRPSVRLKVLRGGVTERAQPERANPKRTQSGGPNLGGVVVRCDHVALERDELHGWCRRRLLGFSPANNARKAKIKTDDRAALLAISHWRTFTGHHYCFQFKIIRIPLPRASAFCMIRIRADIRALVVASEIWIWSTYTGSSIRQITPRPKLEAFNLEACIQVWIHPPSQQTNFF